MMDQITTLQQTVEYMKEDLGKVKEDLDNKMETIKNTVEKTVKNIVEEVNGKVNMKIEGVKIGVTYQNESFIINFIVVICNTKTLV